MDELVRWLRAQLDEDERIAKAASGSTVFGEPGSWKAKPETYGPRVTVGPGENDYWDREANPQVWRCDDPQDDCGEVSAGMMAEGDHIAEHDPARVLREIGAKRQALDHYAEFRRLATGGERAYRLAVGAVAMQIQIMALPYADRPGYQETWRP
ncbi:hypothetical protein FNV66_00890 (plasmid) [Streptomyces sp. S1D4-14]|nr:hypothetical protein FNV66_00890 [Streptomyces sp. S1D4-14]